MSTFGTWLKSERLRLGQTQATFALGTGISTASQVAYERGSRIPDITYLQAAVAHGADLDFLMTGLSKTARAGKNFNWDLLQTLLEGIEKAEKISGARITPKARAQLLRIFYSKFTDSGVVDTDMLQIGFDLSQAS